jgi:hypothetical protein
MAPVVVMHVSADQVVGVAIMGQPRVAAAFTVLVILLMGVTDVLVLGFAVQLERVLIGMSVVGAVEMSVVQVIGVVVVPDCGVAAVVTMLVIVVGMGRMFHSLSFPRVACGKEKTCSCPASRATVRVSLTSPRKKGARLTGEQVRRAQEIGVRWSGQRLAVTTIISDR